LRLTGKAQNVRFNSTILRPIKDEISTNVVLHSVWKNVKVSDRFRGPPSLIFDGYGGVFTGGKRPGPEADHSLPSGAKVKKTGMQIRYPHISLRAHGKVHFILYFTSSLNY
jgi:hypothetical protein